MGEASEEVKSKTDIVDLVGEYVPLVQKGNLFTGCCPFHQEKTASFMVTPSKQTFHCFGCGAGGDVFTFVMKHQNLEFPQALDLLAKRAGVELSKNNGSNGRLCQVNAAAAEFYKGNLKKNPRIQDYLKKTRGLTDESIESFGIGCTNGTSVWSYLRGKGYREKDIIEAGLAKRKESHLYDYFFNRVMFPISFQGSVKGFGGRVLDESAPKYLNTAATPLFSKKDILYGLKPSGIKEKGYAFITEGYFDIVTAHQHGHTNTVAPLGTALTMDQVKLLMKYCKRIYPVFDGDAAGKRAAVKSAHFLFKEKCSGGIIVLPDGEDLDSFLRKGGDLGALVNSALPFSVCLWMNAPHIRRRILDHLLFRSPLEASEFLAHESSPEERRMTAEMSARLTMGKLFPKTSMVVRKDGVEVRMNESLLALFSSGGFKFHEDMAEDYKQQAAKMLKRYLKLKKQYSEAIEK
ncbi:MAG: DNA primase [Thermodesulfovibrionales bacterium]